MINKKIKKISHMFCVHHHLIKLELKIIDWERKITQIMWFMHYWSYIKIIWKIQRKWKVDQWYLLANWMLNVYQWYYRVWVLSITITTRIDVTRDTHDPRSRSSNCHPATCPPPLMVKRFYSFEAEQWVLALQKLTRVTSDPLYI